MSFEPIRTYLKWFELNDQLVAIEQEMFSSEKTYLQAKACKFVRRRNIPREAVPIEF
jgi:hypothetical protein